MTRECHDRLAPSRRQRPDKSEAIAVRQREIEENQSRWVLLRHRERLRDRTSNRHTAIRILE
jgi:hypothetical protein